VLSPCNEHSRIVPKQVYRIAVGKPLAADRGRAGANKEKMKMKNTVQIPSLNSPIQRRSSGLLSQVFGAFGKEAGKGENHILRAERFIWIKKLSFLTLALALCLNGWGQTSVDFAYSGSASTFATTWTVPAGVTSITVEAWGGGGGGAGRTSGGRSGGGGGGGAYVRKSFSVTGGSTVNISIGKGGTGSTTGNSTAGNATTVTYGTVATLTANGGGGCTNNSTTSTGGSGGSSSSSNCTGTAGSCNEWWSGGSGGTGGGSAGKGGGGGGGSGGNSSSGAGGTGATATANTGTGGTGGGAWAGPPASYTGGTGGSCGGTNSNGGNGNVRGGGGAGAGTGATTGGNGGNGSVRITFTCASSAGTLSGTQTVCQGSTTSFSSTQAGGTWTTSSAATATVNALGVVSGVAAGTATITYTVGGSGGCTTFTATRTVTVSASNTPSASIVSNDADNSICPGTSVTFTATPTNGGASPTYQWKLNGSNVGTGGTTYTTTSLTNGATVSVVLTSNVSCPSTTTANSNTITTTVISVPTISYTGSPFSYTAGTAISTLTPTTTATSFSGSLPAGLSLNTTNGQISGTPNTPQASASYTITGTNTNGCTITTAISIGVRPANFQCATATNLACATSSLAGTTVGTTGVAHGISGSCLWSGLVSNYGVWYSFTGDGGSTTITVDPEATLDIELDIMSGSCGSYTCVDDNDGGGDGAPETITFTTVSGTNYYVYVAQFSSAGSAADVGTFTISRTCVSPPANDACSAATNLPCATSNLAGTTVGSADETPPASVATSAKGVWYAFTGNGQITTISSTGATGFDHEQTILTGSSCGSFTIVGSTQDASGSAGTETQTLLTTNGQQYYVWIAYYTSGTTTGTFTISRTCSNPVANDACANAITLTVGSAATAGTFVGDSPSDGTYDDAGYPDVWYKFTPTCDGSYQVALTNSSFDADIYLYTDCSSTTNLLSGGASSANNETGTATLTGGTTYYIRVVDFAQQSSTFSIAVSALSTTNTAPSAITGSSSVCASTAGLTYSVTNVPGNTYNWTLPSGFAQTAGGTTNSITVTAGATSGTISVTATNTCGTSSSSALAITILSAPASVSAGSPATVCVGDATTLSGSAQSSSTGTIGTGTVTSYVTPVNSYFDYNYSQNIYTAAEMTAAGIANGASITSVAFYWEGTGNLTNTNNWQVYLGNTTQTNYSSTTNWVSSTNLTLSYNGAVSLPASAGWFTITLSTPFTYTGNSLVVAVKEAVVGYGAILTYFLSSTVSDNKSIYYYSLSTNPNVASPPTASGVSSTRNNIRLAYTSTPTWAWTSSPSGFTSSLQSPSATPAETTTYTLTATSGAGCTSTASVTITVNQPSVSAINTATGQTLAANDYVWDGSSNTAWTNASNWYVFNGGSSFSVATSDPSTSTNVFIVPSTISCISSTNSPTLSGANDAISSMNVASGASFTNASGSTLSISGNLTNGGTITNSGTLSLTGSLSNSGSLTSAGTMNVATGWVNNGTFTASTGSVVFNGTTSSNISGSNTFYNLTMAKTSGATATISNDITVSNLLTLTTGNIITGTNTVIVSNSSATAISGGGTGSYVRGRLRRAVATGAGGTNVSYVFPIGQSLYEEATLRFATPYSSSTSITAFFTDDNTVNSTLPAGLTQSGTPLTAILNKGYWSIDPVSVPSTPAYTVTLKSIGHMNGATSPTQYTVIKRPNSPLGTWITSEGTHSNTTQADDGTTVTAVRSGLSNFSDFAIAYGGGALPIELTTFQANCSDNNTVDVTWTTASEHNTNYFRVDKSRNGTQWDVLGTIGAAGNSTYSIDYALTDAFPQPGINYYRLTQYDLDGVFETFDAQAAVCSEQQAGTALSTYPNPSSSDFNVDLQTDELEGEGVLLVTDAKGAVVYSQNIKIINGTNNYVIQRFEAAPGIYYISVKSGANTVTTKHSLR
jgi:hypothetical protein